MTFEENLNNLIKRGRKLFGDGSLTMVMCIDPNRDADCQEWLNDLEIFKDRYLNDHPLAKRMSTAIFHKRNDDYVTLLSMLKSISKDRDFVDKMNGTEKISVPKIKQKVYPNTMSFCRTQVPIKKIL